VLLKVLEVVEVEEEKRFVVVEGGRLAVG